MYVALEGGEASGKSTQARLLAERLGAVLTREPGGTAVGAQLRAVLLDPATGALDPRAEALLMAADRAQHVAEVLGPAIAAGRDVGSARSLYSSLAYQSYGRGLDLGAVRALSTFAAAPEPDVVVLLVVDAATRARRLGGVALDRIEAGGDSLHERIDAGYGALAAAEPERWVVVDGGGEVDEVAAELWSALSARIRS